MFSIIIPTYNNLEYLKLCLKSIQKNSKFSHEIIIHINEGNDGTLEYLKSQKYKMSFSKENAGVCVGFNKATALAARKYIVLAHDDMYFCPNWDVVFADELKKYPENKDFFISGTMVQPFESYLEFDCGKTLKDFDEEKLLKNVNQLKFNDFQGTHWQPSLVPKSTWDKVGGFSEEFSPGLGSDPDFNMKLWKMGVRLFKGLGKCRVYHFSSLSLRKKAWNNGAKIFLLKWGISIKFFKKYYLKSDTPFEGSLNEPVKNLIYYFDLIKCKLAYIFHSILSKRNA
tara:strand:+ start:279 stop:1130 length:852 start_codon:yes stop_codon:yes gene_type:complete